MLRWIVIASVLVGCGKMNDAMNATSEVPQKMNNMQVSMDRLKDKMTLQASFTALMDPKYGKNLSPIPFDLMAFAEQLPQSASTGDFIQLVDLWLHKLNDATAPKPPQPPDPLAADATDIDKQIYTQTIVQQKIDADAQAAAFVQQQMQTLVALEAICGFLTDDQTQQIIAEQIYAGGEFADTTYKLLMLRAAFLQNIEMAKLIIPKKMTVGVLESGVKYANSLEQIVRLPFASQIALSVTGVPGRQLELALNPAQVSQNWLDLKANADRDLSGTTAQDLKGDPGQNQALFETGKAKADKLLAIVNQRIAGWAH